MNPNEDRFRLTDADRETAQANGWHLFEIRIEDANGPAPSQSAAPMRPECSEELREMFARWNREGKF